MLNLLLLFSCCCLKLLARVNNVNCFTCNYEQRKALRALHFLPSFPLLLPLPYAPPCLAAALLDSVPLNMFVKFCSECRYSSLRFFDKYTQYMRINWFCISTLKYITVLYNLLYSTVPIERQPSSSCLMVDLRYRSISYIIQMIRILAIHEIW